MPIAAQPMPRPIRGGLRVLAVGVAIALVALPVLYVASVGPAAQLYLDDSIGADAYFSFYAPLFAVSERSEFLSRNLERYIAWWDYER
jgi:hypothetical protein